MGSNGQRRVINTDITPEDQKIESSLRPQMLKDYIGQEKIKSNLKVYIDAAKSRGESLDHVLFYGPPGLGKTTLSCIIANEMGVNIKITSGPAIEKPGEIAAVLNNLQEGDVLFVDEIHRLNHTSGSAAFYFGGSDDQGRAFNRSSAGSVWGGAEAGVLYAGGADHHYYSVGRGFTGGD